MRRLHGDRESFEWAASEYLRMSGVYWGATAMALLGRLGEMDREGILDELAACQVAGSGGFAASPGHDPHLLYTLSAVQLVLLLDAREDARVDLGAAVAYVRGLQVRVGGGLLDETARAARSVGGTGLTRAGLQRPDGSFQGDRWGEVDTRFSYCALSCLALLGRLDAVDVPKAVSRWRRAGGSAGPPRLPEDEPRRLTRLAPQVDFVMACRNFDGGFGARPGDESHAGQVFVCVGALAIAGALDRLDAPLLAWWLAERQTPGGGLNGRPEKQQVRRGGAARWWVPSL